MNDRHRQHLTMPSINTLKSGINTQTTQTEQMNADFYGLIIKTSPRKSASSVCHTPTHKS